MPFRTYFTPTTITREYINCIHFQETQTIAIYREIPFTLPHNGLVSKPTITNLTLHQFILQNSYLHSYILDPGGNAYGYINKH